MTFSQNLGDCYHIPIIGKPVKCLKVCSTARSLGDRKTKLETERPVRSNYSVLGKRQWGYELNQLVLGVVEMAIEWNRLKARTIYEIVSVMQGERL